MIRAAEESAILNNSEKTADKVYSNDNEIVTDSVFKRQKPISPSGKAIQIDDSMPIY